MRGNADADRRHQIIIAMITLKKKLMRIIVGWCAIADDIGVTEAVGEPAWECREQRHSSTVVGYVRLPRLQVRGDLGLAPTSSIYFYFSFLANLQQAIEAANGLPTNSCCKVLGTKLIGSTGRALRLSHGLADDPDRRRLLRLGNGNSRWGGNRTSDTQSLVQFLGSFLTGG